MTMANPSSEDEGLLREWAPLTTLLQQIPLKAQRGIFTHELNLTCVDALTDFIALGTNLGLVYWYNRRKGELQRLRCENTASAVTCVKVISTVDYMVAAGNEQGIVSVFQIPKDPPDCLPESMKPRRKKQVERYTITGLHTSPITAIEWSLNGMKLFSGDKNGLVVLTEIDFYMHLSKSLEVLNEKYEIVQLSYCQQLLLVSTIYRSIVCHRDDRWRVAQVGQKERKSLGKLGATFCVSSERPQDLTLYASRPGLRLWLADKNGIVQQTLIYKDTMMREHRQVPLVNPVPPHLKNSRVDHMFGPLHVFKENLLVTYNQDTVYVLNPTDIFVVATVSDLRRVQDVSVTKDEIFILEGDRSIIRVAYLPENVPEQLGVDLPCGEADDPLTVDQVFLHIVGDPKVQEQLKDDSSNKDSVWTYVASEMAQSGYPFASDYGAKQCQQKWNHMIKSYDRFQKTKAWNSGEECPTYFETLEHILNPFLKIDEHTVVAVTSVDTGDGSPAEPQLKKMRQDNDLVYDTDSLLSTISQCSEESELLETSEVADDPNSIYVDLLNGSDSIYYDDEHITVYPVTNSDTQLTKEVVIPTTNMEDNQNLYILVTPSFDKLSDYVKDSEDDEEVVNTGVSYSYEADVDPETINYEEKQCHNSEYSEEKELVVTPKSNLSLRPVPTPAQALMALVTRIGREEKERDNLRKYNIEKRFAALENAIWKQNVVIMELTEKANSFLNELLEEESSESE